MKSKLIIMMAVLLGMMAQINAQTLCNADRVEYVEHKNTPNPATGTYTLTRLATSSTYKASQAYHYSGEGRITQVRVYGDYPGGFWGANLRIGIYNVGPNDKPTTPIAPPTDQTWWYYYDNAGFHDFTLPGGGVNVSSNFAVVVEVLPSVFPTGELFNLDINGTGEGRGENLSSLAGSATGQNWITFSQDADFYIEPIIRHNNTPAFPNSFSCVAAGGTVAFNSVSYNFTKDSMFNTIGLNGYSGSNTYYSWNFGDGGTSTLANPSHTFVSPGFYTVSVTTTIEGWNTTCQRTATMQVSVGLNLTATGGILNCYNGADGTSTASIVGGKPPYTYSLTGLSQEYYSNNGAFTGLAAGSYTMYVKDNLGCVDSDTFLITQPTPIVFGTSTVTNTTCGSSNGSFIVSATGGTGAKEYSLNKTTWQASGTFTGLAGGAYQVYVKDTKGCLDSTIVSINNQGAPSITSYTNQNVSCFGYNDGSIQVIASGGTGTLQYSINGGLSWQASNTFNNLRAGNFVVSVKDANQCLVNTPIIAVIQPQQLTLSASVVQQVLCNGNSDGIIRVVSSSGGSGAHSFSVDGVNYVSNTLFPNLSAGTYTVYVKDVAGCTGTTEVTISQPAVLAISVTPANASCFGSSNGEMNSSATGGTAPYQFRYLRNGVWSSWSSIGYFGNLEAGLYTVMASDAKGCETFTTVTIGQPAAISLATLVVGNTACGDSNANVLVSATGGTAPYEYLIDEGPTWETGSSVVFDSLAAGGHILFVRDVAGCLNAFTVTVANSAGPAITGVAHTNATCYGGSDGSIHSITYSGGTGTILFSMDLVNWVNAVGFTSFTGLSAGTKRVYIKDAVGCLNFYDVVIGQGPQIIISNIATVDNSCFGGSNGSAVVTAAGGTGTLEYSIDGVNFQSSNSFTGLSAGGYQFYVKDLGGCGNTARANISQPDQIKISLGILNVAPCNGDENGRIIINATGGTGAYTYSLNGNNYFGSNTFTGLNGGTYTVYVKDAAGCVVTATTLVNEPTTLVIASAATDVSCTGGNNGVIDLSVSGGVPAYSYFWGGSIYTEDRFNLSIGQYSVSVVDANGCEKTKSFVIEQPANPIVLNAVVTDASNASASDGLIDITVTGGTGPYTFDWSNSAVSQDLSDVAAGTYSVNVIDANNCQASASFTVSFETGLLASPENNLKVSVYPNPAKDNLTVKGDGVSFESVRVYNLIGKMVFENNEAASQYQLNLDTFTEGMYILQVTIDGNLINKRFEVIK
jgi:hypothetical protein